MAKAFPSHHMANDVDLRYLGTHYGYDVYIAPGSPGTPSGMMYAVWGVNDSDYCCAMGYYISRTQRTDIANPRMGLAAAVALLHHPEYTAMVLAAHK